MSMSQRVSFMARMLSVVQAIQPEPASPPESAVPSWRRLEASKSSMRKGMSCTPMVNRGRRRGVGDEGGSLSATEKGILERIEMSYTEMS